ncbi:MAG: hypothetical protein E7358_04275 [Clostridiales bacterium]|nr:hypothetical protein [Clostridiales bacterium]
MSIAVDIILIVIFLVIVIFFTKYGLDRALYKIGKAWLAVACAFFFGPMITNFLEDLFITNMVTNAVHVSLKELITHNANGYNLAELFASMPANFVNFLDGLGASLTALEAEFGTYTEANDTIIRIMAERIATPCISGISTILGHVVGFVIPWLFMKWIAYELKKDEKHKFFRFFDYVGGFLVGVAVGYAAVMGLSILTSTIFQVVVAFDSSVQVMAIYDSSYVFKFLAEFDTIGVIVEFFQSFSNTALSLIK